MKLKLFIVSIVILLIQIQLGFSVPIANSTAALNSDKKPQSTVGSDLKKKEIEDAIGNSTTLQLEREHEERVNAKRINATKTSAESDEDDVENDNIGNATRNSTSSPVVDADIDDEEVPFDTPAEIENDNLFSGNGSDVLQRLLTDNVGSSVNVNSDLLQKIEVKSEVTSVVAFFYPRQTK